MKFENMKVWFSIPKDERYSFYLNEFMKNLQFFFFREAIKSLEKGKWENSIHSLLWIKEYPV